MKIAQDPQFEGGDETEKALVKELKSEIESSKSQAPAKAADPEIQAAAKELAGGLMDMVKTMVNEQSKAVKSTDRPGEGADEPTDVAKMSKQEKFAGFVKALLNKDGAEAERLTFSERTKALAEGVDADGGYLVPDEFRAELIQEVLTTQSFRQFATVIPMKGKLLSIPRLSSDVKVYWGTENRTITTTTADFGEMQLTPFRLNAIIYTSKELFDDSAISIFDILRQRFAARVRDEEMKVFLNGNGTTQPKGINQETLPSVSAGSALTPDHLTTAFYKLPEGYRANARWIINSRVMAHLESAKESGTGAYLYPSLQSEVKTLKGRPILVTDYQPSSKLTLGDLSYYYIGDRQNVTMDVTSEAAGTWEKYQVAMRVIERVDGEVALTSAFVQITNTNIH